MTELKAPRTLARRKAMELTDAEIESVAGGHTWTDGGQTFTGHYPDGNPQDDSESGAMAMSMPQDDE